MSEEEESAYGAEIARIFRLRKDPEHSDRFQTEWGTKTNLGLTRVLLEIARRIKMGEKL